MLEMNFGAKHVRISEEEMIEKHNRLLRYARHSNQALENNAKHNVASMHSLIIYETGAVFSFIPKNACSTLRFSLAVANGAIQGQEHFHWIHNNNQTFRASLKELVCAPFTFTVLRDPLLRVASAYMDKVVMRWYPLWRLLDTVDPGMDPDRITFRKFIELIVKGKKLRLDFHWRPQIDFLVYEDYDAYFRFEDFVDAIPLIEKRAGLKIQDTRSIAEHSNNRFDIVDLGCCADMSPAELRRLHREGKTVELKRLYDDTLLAEVQAAYQQDIDLYKRVFSEMPLSLQ